jgi:hypothetical protein
MFDEGHFQKVASVVLGIVCVFLFVHLARRFNRPPAKAVASRTAHASFRRPLLLPAPRQRSQTEKLESPAKGKSEPQESKRVVRTRRPRIAPSELKNTPSPAKATMAESKSEPLPVETPALAEFTPLGYVEKADGSTEAIVSEGSRVFLVHEGETFADRYRVQSVSASLVKATDTWADPSPDLNAPETTRLAVQRAPAKSSPESISARLPNNLSLRPPELGSEAVRGRGQGETLVKAISAPLATPKVESLDADTLKPGGRVGYVETASGETNDIVSEGGEIKFVSSEQVVASAPREVDDTKLAENRTPEAPAGPGTAVHGHADSSRLPPLPAALSPPGQAPRDEVSRVLPGALNVDQELDGLVSVGTTSGPGPPRSPPPWLLLDVGATEGRDRAVSAQDVAARDGPTESPPADTFKIKAIGYVEKGDGSVQAIVARGSDTLFVSVGDVFADRFRVVEISDSTVEMVDESPPRPLLAIRGQIPTDGRSEKPLELAGRLAHPESPRSSLATKLGLRARGPRDGILVVQKPTFPKEARAAEPVRSDSNSSTGSGVAIRRQRDLKSAMVIDPPAVLPLWGVAGKHSEALASFAHSRGRSPSSAFSQVLGSQSIASLPLEVSGRLLSLPEIPRTSGRPVKAEASAAGAIDCGSPSGHGGAIVRDLSKNGVSQGTRTLGSSSTVASAAASSADGLQFQFSIGDNACYLPR